MAGSFESGGLAGRSPCYSCSGHITLASLQFGFFLKQRFSGHMNADPTHLCLSHLAQRAALHKFYNLFDNLRQHRKPSSFKVFKLFPEDCGQRAAGYIHSSAGKAGSALDRSGLLSPGTASSGPCSASQPPAGVLLALRPHCLVSLGREPHLTPHGPGLCQESRGRIPRGRWSTGCRCLPFEANLRAGP